MYISQRDILQSLNEEVLQIINDTYALSTFPLHNLTRRLHREESSRPRGAPDTVRVESAFVECHRWTNTGEGPCDCDGVDLRNCDFECGLVSPKVVETMRFPNAIDGQR